MRALVTGASGFIGRHLVESLSRLGWSVIAVSRGGAGSDSVMWLRADLGRLATPGVLTALAPVDVVFHLAAEVPRGNRAVSTVELVRSNVLGTAAALAFVRRHPGSVFVYASSLGVIGTPRELPITERHPCRPRRLYHLTKRIGELLCERQRRRQGGTVSLRISSPYGPGMNTGTVLPRFVEAALDGRDLELQGSGCRTQNFIHVDDVVAACLQAARGVAGGIFNIAGPAAVSMRELAEHALAVAGRGRSAIKRVDVPDPQESVRWDVDVSAARRAFGWLPRVDLPSGLARYAEALASTPAVAEVMS